MNSISDMLSEAEFKVELCKWLIKNDRCCFLKDNMTIEEYAEEYRLPDFDYIHTQSYVDENGDLITMLKSEIRLRAWETKNGYKPKTFTFYHFLKTFIDNPEAEPYPVGYMVCRFMND